MGDDQNQKMVGGNVFEAPRPSAARGSFFDQVVVITPPKRTPAPARRLFNFGDLGKKPRKA